MLKDSFYRVMSSKSLDNVINAHLKINKEHEIFKGHFPTIPVVPGVCMLQLVKELLEDEVGKKLTLSSAGILKFLAVINPETHPEVAVEIKYSTLESGELKAEGTISGDNLVFFKLNKALYQ